MRTQFYLKHAVMFAEELVVVLAVEKVEMRDQKQKFYQENVGLYCELFFVFYWVLVLLWILKKAKKPIRIGKMG